MEWKRGQVVRSLAGHDQGSFLTVLEAAPPYAVVADGKRRPLERPKRKKRKHTAFAARCQCRVAEKIRSDEKITNSELRKTLAIFGEEGNPDQEG